LEEATTFLLILFSMPDHKANTQMSFCPKTPKWESWNSQNWDSATLQAHNFVCRPPIEVRFEQSCSPHQDLSNGMWHATCMQGNRGESWLLVVGSQIANLTPDPSFGYNLCFKNLNGSCELILNIYVPRDFQWYKKLFNPMGFDPWNWSLKIRESIENPTPEVGVHLGVWGFIFSHSPTFLGAWNVTPDFILGSHLQKPLLWLWTQG